MDRDDDNIEPDAPPSVTYGRAHHVLFAYSWLLVAYIAVFHAGSYLGLGMTQVEVLFFPAFGAMFISFGAGIMSMNGELGYARVPGIRFKDGQFEQLFGEWRRLVYVVGANAAVCFVLLMTTQPSGQPEQRGDRYFVNDHGNRVEVSEATFHRNDSRTLRMFSGHALLFSIVPATYLASRRTRARRDDLLGGTASSPHSPFR